MDRARTIADLVVTPVAVADPPLRNVVGIHQPFALRAILELRTEAGMVGLSETYGDSNLLSALDLVRPLLAGTSIHDLRSVMRLVRTALAGRPERPGSIVAPGTLPERTVAACFAAIEVACLDLQGKVANLPLYQVLGGRARREVAFSGYLFFKPAGHLGMAADRFGACETPEAVVEQARMFVDRHGFRSLKLKGGVFAPEMELEAMRLLREAFPDHPLRIDPNGGWTVATTLRLLDRLEGTLEYLEDPVLGRAEMAEVARATPLPLATNMCVVGFDDIAEAVRMNSVRIILSDHHYWGGLSATLNLAAICQTFGLGLSMHSNSHLGISLAAMTHLATACPRISYACDTHYPWQTEDVLDGGPISFTGGAIVAGDAPGLGVALDRTELARLHRQYLDAGIRDRDDAVEMRKYDPGWTPRLPRF